ncbi:MAG: thiolase family protein [Microbacterium sp.]
MTRQFVKDTIISGFARSEVGRRLYRSSLELTIDACLAAIADAGLTPADIDGLITWPDETAGGAGSGFGNPSVSTMQDTLGLNLEWYVTGGLDGLNVTGSVIDACMAVATGLARHVLVYRTVTEASAQSTRRRAPSVGGGAQRTGGWQQWVAPYAAASAGNWAALSAQRHFHEYGTTPEQLGAIAVGQRTNAGLNPDAIYRDPMTLDDYLSSPVISTPIRMFDCDIAADGAHAFIISRADYATDAPRPAIRFEAVAASRHGYASWIYREDQTTMASHDAGARLWRETDLRPGDVDIAQLYDGFSIFVLLWLEALGFCEKGESGPFVEGGARIALDGDLPVNTGGGQLSEGRYLGWGALYEACLQLRGDAGERQVKKSDVGIVTGGGGNIAQVFLLSRHR